MVKVTQISLDWELTDSDLVLVDQIDLAAFARAVYEEGFAAGHFEREEALMNVVPAMEHLHVELIFTDPHDAVEYKLRKP